MIVVPRQPEFMDGDAASPAMTALSAMDAPSVSPVVPSLLHDGNDASLADKSKGTTKTQAGMNGGRWTEQEHQSFLAGLRLYGREWKKVASKIKTRTSAQIRSHAQKYFAKLARDDETRRHGGALAGGMLGHSLGLDDTAGLHGGYMSDDGSSNSTGNLSGDDGGADTDLSSATQSQQHQYNQQQQQPQPTPTLPRSIMPVHPFPSPMGAPPTPTTNAASFHSRNPQSLLVAGPLVPIRKRKVGDTSTPTPTMASFKQRKTVDAMARLPSPEELVETVSPTVRQRLSSLIDAEICALQVLSCYTWAQQQQQQQQQPADLTVHVSPHRLSHARPSPSASSVFSAPSSGPMKLSMIAAERSPSIF